MGMGSSSSVTKHSSLFPFLEVSYHVQTIKPQDKLEACEQVSQFWDKLPDSWVLA